MKKAAATRLHILQKAFELIYEKGYQTTSVDDIIATTQVTKGAFYYHFKTKDEMGVAIINELLKPSLTDGITQPTQPDENPVTAVYKLMHHLLIENTLLKVEYGCPVANFTQEMTPWHTDFATALQEITHLWTSKMESLVEEGKTKKLIRQDIDAQQVTLFIMSGYWGIRNFGKLENGKDVYWPFLAELKRYLGTLS